MEKVQADSTRVRMPPPTRKNILFLNEIILLIREYYSNVNTYRIVFTAVWTLSLLTKMT